MSEHLAKVIDYSEEYKLKSGSKDLLIQHSLRNLNLKYEKVGTIFIIEDKYFLRRDISDKTSVAAYYATSGNKWVTNTILKKNSINIPKSIQFEKNDYAKALKWFHNHNDSVAMKPNNGDLGKNIHLNVKNEEHFKFAWNDIFKKFSKIIIEEMLVGNDYRLLVIGGSFCAATIREPFLLKGDGLKTIKELIELKNKERSTHPYKSVRRNIVVDSVINRKLIENNLTLESILEKNKKVYLQSLPNIAKGGEHTDITNDVHIGFKEIVEYAFKVFPPAGYLGFDIMAEDITKDPKNQKWGIIEVDSHACLLHHHLPVNGSSRDVISLMLLDNLKNSRLNESLIKRDNIADVYTKGVGKFSIGYLVHKQLLKKAAWSRNLEIDVISNKLWSVNDENKKHYFFDNMSDMTSYNARIVTNGKNSTKELLSHHNINIPKGKIFNKKTIDEAWEFACDLNKPVVVKPVSGTGGDGIVTNIKEKETFLEAINKNNLERFIVEEHIFGNDYRILIVSGQFVATSKRTPANVTGDGIHSLDYLINKKNKKRATNPHLGKYPIHISFFAKKELDKRGIKLDTILEKGNRIFLQDVANVGAGGDSLDVSEDVHPLFKKILINAFHLFPTMHYCGFDIQAEDINKSPYEQEWAILEINANADIGFHHFPWKGKPRDVASSLIDSLFPNSKEESKLIKKKCVRLVIGGKVQNVGYRKWLRKEAFLRDISVWDQNINNDVECILIGMPNAIDNLIERCYKGPIKAFVESININILNEDITNYLK